MSWTDWVSNIGSSWGGGDGASGWGDWFSGSDGSGYGDWLSNLGSSYGGGSGSTDWGSFFDSDLWSGGSGSGSTASSGYNWSGLLNSLTGSSGDASTGSALSTLFQGILGGIGNSANVEAALKAAKAQQEEKGLQDRKSTAFELDLKNYYNQQDKHDKRVALDSYGAFSQLGNWAPDGYTEPARPVVPAKPVASK